MSLEDDRRGASAVAARASDPLVSLGSSLSGILWLRWIWLGGQLVLVLLAPALSGWELPIGLMSGLILVGGLSNLGLVRWLRREPNVRQWLVAGVLILDTAELTALLLLSGGAYNPFSSMYLLYLVFGAMVLRPAWTWLLVGACTLGYSSLYVLEVPPPGGVHPGDTMRLHLLGMWLAFVLVGPFVALGISGLRSRLLEYEARLERARRIAGRREKLASLGTLAAGAAHELSTPLATIGLVAKDLEIASSGEEQAADARLIQQQVQRCSEIVHHLAADAGVGRGELPRTVPIGELIDEAIEHLRDQVRLEISLAPGLEHCRIELPVLSVARALEGLLRNALDASRRGDVVSLRARVGGNRLLIEVTDRGCGMEAEVLERAGEPFFTTKAIGRGTGLGLFYARSVLESLGGGLQLESAPGRGTRATMWLPMEV